MHHHTLNPVRTQRLAQLAQQVQELPAGQRGALYAAACAELGMSLATLHRHLAKVAPRPQRKRRDDAGAVCLPRTEAIAISAMLMESHRKNSKRLMSVGQAVQILRANGEIRAQRLDAATGELVPLSDSAIARALRAYGMHPEQINRPAPAVELRSLHPNHVWQIDASLCVLYYLHANTERETGLQVMQHSVFYKNKPSNLRRIEADRVWSYEATDHYSGAIKLRYVMGAESGANLAECFIEFIQKCDGDPMHGVPYILMMDMGSANTSGLFANLARRLQVRLIAHAPGNARATGQVEKARDLIEKSFESGLRLRPVRDLQELNHQAQRWAQWFNGHRVHTRHGKTRYDAWMSIREDQLRIAPSVQVCQALLTHHPELRKVSVTQTVSFGGAEYDVRDVPGVMVGEKLSVAINPYAQDAATIVLTDADGNELLHSVPMVARDGAGFRTDANVIGEDWARPQDTQLDATRKELERVAMDAQTDAEAEAARKAKALPFGGRIDPYKVIEQAPERVFLPRRGTALEAGARLAQQDSVPPLTHFAAARALVAQGVAMTPALLATLRQQYPEGVPEDKLPEIAARLTVRAGLRVVGGDA
ncbi:DDE-type integrase/transposase/recombinase [Extensimonas vulgaris]|uniref:Integrase-like protein n=1 Tax=Extensimonas vulgaris TaxID=1031594 RepID=A0A369ANQ1_9BURK|nr:DDE-type integrase/transposase/recombinase [Extensimonas vulgaris]RCX10715.1 integrase-like protein [Extensimonas vulgaris]TWI41357.1 integrase-like protein [Extensimonas vulgaris]TXD16824.1 transposase family protein [Extensimonas vulgaris]